jgi:hypothetical protein
VKAEIKITKIAIQARKEVDFSLNNTIGAGINGYRFP